MFSLCIHCSVTLSNTGSLGIIRDCLPSQHPCGRVSQNAGVTLAALRYSQTRMKLGQGWVCPRIIPGLLELLYHDSDIWYCTWHFSLHCMLMHASQDVCQPGTTVILYTSLLLDSVLKSARYAWSQSRSTPSSFFCSQCSKVRGAWGPGRFYHMSDVHS